MFTRLCCGGRPCRGIPVIVICAGTVECRTVPSEAPGACIGYGFFWRCWARIWAKLGALLAGLGCPTFDLLRPDLLLTAVMLCVDCGLACGLGKVPWPRLMTGNTVTGMLPCGRACAGLPLFFLTEDCLELVALPALCAPVPFLSIMGGFAGGGTVVMESVLTMLCFSVLLMADVGGVFA